VLKVAPKSGFARALRISRKACPRQPVTAERGDDAGGDQAFSHHAGILSRHRTQQMMAQHWDAGMSAPPKTELKAAREEEQMIRAAVRDADPASLGPGRCIAQAIHAAALLDLLSDLQQRGLCRVDRAANRDHDGRCAVVC